MEKQTSAPKFWDDPPRAKTILSELNELRKTIDEYNQLPKDYEEIDILFELFKEEPEESVEKEIEQKIKILKGKFEKINLRKLFKDPQDKSNAIVNLHSGAGGTEACDWCEMLLRMYLRWAERKNYLTEIAEILAGEEAGVKNVTFLVKGAYACGYLKSEIGVHRLVRISPFDANKRRHTSFASCDVIPEVSDEIKINLREEDLRIDTFRASGHGGQHVNKTESAVRVIHLPTGIIAQCQNERSQFKNKATALKVLKARLYQHEREKLRAEKQKYYTEKGTIAWGHQIRSYVFCPYTMVKDHRTNLQVSNVAKVLDGEIDEFIESWLKSQR